MLKDVTIRKANKLFTKNKTKIQQNRVLSVKMYNT